MKFQPQWIRQQQSLMSSVLVALSLSACAQAPTQPPGSPEAAVQSVQGLAALQGTYLSPCGELMEGLHAIDTMSVRSTSATDAVVTYRKKLYSQAGCSVASHIISVEQPEVRWKSAGSVQIDGQTVHKVVQQFTAGELRVRISNEGRVQVTEEAYVLKIGGESSRGIPLQRRTEAQERKDLYRLEGDKLFVSDMSTVDKDGFPVKLDAEPMMIKVPEHLLAK